MTDRRPPLPLAPLLLPLLLAGSACDASAPDTAASHVPARAECAPSPAASWLPDEGRAYRRTAGSDEVGDSAWIGRPLGVAYAGGDVWVFDGARPGLLTYPRDFGSVRRVGRGGRGPGEFRTLSHISGDWVDTAGDTVLVYDAYQVHRFSRAGEFIDRSMPAPGELNPFDVRRVEAWRGGIVFARDIPDHDDGSRRLEFWHARADTVTPITTIGLPSMTEVSGGYISGGPVDHAQPDWDLQGDCLYVIDGSNPFVLRIVLPRLQVDTLRLGAYEPPEPREADWSRKLELASISGVMSAAEVRNATPNAPARWEDILVDPSGRVWIEPWRPRSYRGEPLRAMTVSPTGERTDVPLDWFPTAFADEGAFISETRNAVDEVSLTLYEIASATPASPGE